MEEAIRALLKADATIAAHCAGRVNFGAHLQGEPFPAIILNTVSDTEGLTLDGPDGLPSARLQVDCYAETYGAAKILSRDVRKLLNGYAGGAIQGVFYGASRDGRDETADGIALFRISADFIVRFSR